jgi:hypothetical protein
VQLGYVIHIGGDSFGDLRWAHRARSDEVTTIRPPATLRAKKTMKIQTPSRFQNSRRAREARV